MLGVDDLSQPVVEASPKRSNLATILSSGDDLSGQSEDFPNKPTPSRHRFEKPIHNVKDYGADAVDNRCSQAAELVSSSPGYWLVR